MLEMPLWEIAARGIGVYLAIAVVVRLIPKRQTGDLAPNDFIALIIVGSLGASAIVGESTGMLDMILMIVVVLLLDHAFNLLEYHVPRFRRIVQDTPTLLIYEGKVLSQNLRREKLTEEELSATLRKRGVRELSVVKYAILEADGHISVVEHE